MWKCQSTAVVKTALARLRWSFSGVHAFTGGRWREEGGGKDEFKTRTSSWLICRHSNANHFGTNPVEPIDPSHLCLKHAEWTLIFNQGMHASAAYVLGEWANYLSASSRIRGIFFLQTKWLLANPSYHIDGDQMFQYRGKRSNKINKSSAVTKNIDDIFTEAVFYRFHLLPPAWKEWRMTSVDKRTDRQSLWSRQSCLTDWRFRISIRELQVWPHHLGFLNIFH